MMFYIGVMLALWAVLTGIALYVIQKYKSERASLIGSMFFLAGAITVALLAPLVFDVREGCIACDYKKHIVDTLVQVFIISWGAIGANLLSACISHK